MTTIQQVLFDSLVVTFFVLGVAAFTAGTGLIIGSTKTLRLFAAMNRSVSTRKVFKPVCVPREIEPVLLQHRIWFGAALIAGALYSLYGLGPNFNSDTVARALTAHSELSYALVPVIVEGLRWALLVSGVLVLAIGIILCIAPNALRAIEAYTNHWYSLRKATVGMEKEYLPLDKWVETFPKTAGIVVALCALIIMISSGNLLFVH